MTTTAAAAWWLGQLRRHKRQQLSRARDIWRRCGELEAIGAREIAAELRAGAIDMAAGALCMLDDLDAGRRPRLGGPDPDDTESFARAERYLRSFPSTTPPAEAVAAFLRALADVEAGDDGLGRDL